MKNFSQYLSRIFFSLFAFLFKSNRLKKIPVFLRVVVVISGAFLVGGCYNFYKNTTFTDDPGRNIPILINLGKTFVIHSGASVFMISNLIVDGDSVAGDFVGNYVMPYKKLTFPAPLTNNRYIKKRGDKRIINEAHFYIENVKTRTLHEVSRKVFALKDVTRLDIYNHNSGRTFISWVGGALIFGIGGFVAINLVLLMLYFLGGSCPFVYVNTGDGYAFTGEIYSGAVYAPLERDDYLQLPLLVAENGSYKIKMSNELKEIQHTNLTELIVADYQVKADVLIDKYGKYQTAVKLNPPVSATDFTGNNILNLVSKKDSLVTGTLADPDNIPLLDGAILTFDLPQGAQSGKLFLRARNSIWLDHVYKSSNELFGGWYDNWQKKQNKADPAELKEWPLSQKIPLSVFIEKNGEWVFCDYFNMAGPMALKDDVLAIDLTGIDKGPVKIKLESGCYFWEIDYAGMDFSINLPVNIQTVRADNAITNEEKLVTDLLLYDDLKYYVQEEIGNVADISFPVPPKSEAYRTVILHSKGYYQILSEAKGLPKIKSLKELKEPGQFLEFSRELMKADIEKIKNNRSLSDLN